MQHGGSDAGAPGSKGCEAGGVFAGLVGAGGELCWAFRTQGACFAIVSKAVVRVDRVVKVPSNEMTRT